MPFSSRPVGARVAVVAAVADLVVLAAFHLLRPDVDPLTRPTSEYALGAFGAVASAAVFAVGIGALALAWTWRAARVGAAVLAVFGLVKLVQPFFPIDPPGVVTTAGQVHDVLGTVAFLALPLAAVLLARTVRAPLAAALLVVAVVAVLAADAVGLFGLAQRVYLVGCSLWMIVAALAAPRRDG